MKMSKRRLAGVGLVMAAATLLGACASEQADHGGEVCVPVDSAQAEKAPADTAGMVKVVNRVCPVVQGDAIPGGWAKKELVVEWRGQSVAFCCAGCKPRWAKMTDAQKDAALAKATAAAGT
ncbi:MAG: hypothetical protein AB7K52_02920 [Phycisphaerales bacterium]